MVDRFAISTPNILEDVRDIHNVLTHRAVFDFDHAFKVLQVEDGGEVFEDGRRDRSSSIRGRVELGRIPHSWQVVGQRS